MASFTISIPTGATTRVVNALCAFGDYQDPIVNPIDGTSTPNPTLRGEFARSIINRMIVEAVKQGENRLARIAAEATLKDTLTTISKDVDAVGISTV